MTKMEQIWEVLVVGGGPAGMMAAGRAAELAASSAGQGAKVILIEKNDSLGKKLLITGGGRCNVTNAEWDNRKLLAKFKDAGKFLFSTFAQYNVAQTLDFFHSRKMATKVENEQRVFPQSNKAESVWQVLVEYLKQGKVTILSDSPVTGLVIEKNGDDDKINKVAGVKVKSKIIRARQIIIATGGTSRPETGSTGDAYAWLEALGHTVSKPTPSLVPIATKEPWIKRLAGVSLSNVKITTLQNGVKQGVGKGKILFTHVGLSGPTILNMSKDIGELLKYGAVTLLIDLLPTLDYGALDLKLQAIFKSSSNKMFKNSLAGLVPSAMAPVLVELSGLAPETPCHSLKREARIKLGKLLKALPIEVSKLLGVEKAVITSGGVALNEVDFKTMRSRLYPNLYLIGDLLNIDRPSGGYSLQLCWTTGYVAGNAAAAGSTH